MELRRLEPRPHGSVGDQVYRTLREAIVQGGFEPNERVVEAQVAEALGVSRTPVREAIYRLEMDGLVRSLPNRSTVAVWFSPEDVRHTYNLRARIEGYAARLLAERGNPGGVGKLEAICREFASGSPEERDGLNRRFHQTIVDECGAERVIRVAMSLVEHSLMLRLYLLHTTEDQARSMREHAAIVGALREGDGPLADRLVCEHLEWARDILLTRGR